MLQDVEEACVTREATGFFAHKQRSTLEIPGLRLSGMLHTERPSELNVSANLNLPGIVSELQFVSFYPMALPKLSMERHLTLERLCEPAH